MLLCDERFAGDSIDACEDRQHMIDISAENITIFINNTIRRGARTCKCVMFGDEVLNFTVHHAVISNTASRAGGRESRYVCYRNVTSSDCWRSDAVPFTRIFYRQTFVNNFSPGFQIDIRDQTSIGVLQVVISIEFHLMPTTSKYFVMLSFVVVVNM